jgi:hypothetical protein
MHTRLNLRFLWLPHGFWCPAQMLSMRTGPIMTTHADTFFPRFIVSFFAGNNCKSASNRPRRWTVREEVVGRHARLRILQVLWLTYNKHRHHHYYRQQSGRGRGDGGSGSMLQNCPDFFPGRKLHTFGQWPLPTLESGAIAAAWS